MYEAIKRIPASGAGRVFKLGASSEPIHQTKRCARSHADSWLRTLGIYGEEKTVWGFRGFAWRRGSTSYELALTTLFD
jgi:hypothetical protein